jgi:hypothetical protein
VKTLVDGKDITILAIDVCSGGPKLFQDGLAQSLKRPGRDPQVLRHDPLISFWHLIASGRPFKRTSSSATESRPFPHGQEIPVVEKGEGCQRFEKTLVPPAVTYHVIVVECLGVSVKHKIMQSLMLMAKLEPPPQLICRRMFKRPNV